MPEFICRVGNEQQKYRYEDVKLEYKGYLSIVSFQVEGAHHRQNMMERGNAVVVLPVDFTRRQIYMIEQRRHIRAFSETPEGREALSRAMAGGRTEPFELDAELILHFELPAGVIDGEESPAEAAGRELQEETGLIAGASALRQVATYYPSLGSSTERMTCFIAELPDPVEKSEAHGDGDEQITVWRMSWEEAFDLLDSGKIISGSSAVLLRELRIIDLMKK